jgi:hypothetical protein
MFPTKTGQKYSNKMYKVGLIYLCKDTCDFIDSYSGKKIVNLEELARIASRAFEMYASNLIEQAVTDSDEEMYVNTMIFNEDRLRGKIEEILKDIVLTIDRGIVVKICSRCHKKLLFSKYSAGQWRNVNNRICKKCNGM